jgi:hypothetical protein
MLVSSFLLGIGLSYFVFNRFAPEVQFLSLVCLWNCHEHNCLSGFGTYRSGTGNEAWRYSNCAAADDITAWCLLAVVIAIVKAEILSARYMLFRLLQFMCW